MSIKIMLKEMPAPQLLYNYIAELLNRKKKFNNLTIKQFRFGFTLIELLVVISIIAILITVIVATFGTTQEKARDNRRKTDLDAFKKALELHKSDTVGSTFYPDCSTSAVAATDSCQIDEREDFDGTDVGGGLNVKYMKKWPQEPSAGVYYYQPTGCEAAGCTDYVLVACIENSEDSDSELIPTTTVIGSDCDNVKYGAIYTIENP